jgi:hypothetical protein
MSVSCEHLNVLCAYLFAKIKTSSEERLLISDLLRKQLISVCSGLIARPYQFMVSTIWLGGLV